MARQHEVERRHTFSSVIAAISLLLATAVSAPAPAHAVPEEVLIFLPLERDRTQFVVDDDALVAIPGGWLMEFEVEISTFSPLHKVDINGRSQPAPHAMWARLREVVRLERGENRIVVAVTTAEDTVAKEFLVTVRDEPNSETAR